MISNKRKKEILLLIKDQQVRSLAGTTPFVGMCQELVHLSVDERITPDEYRFIKERYLSNRPDNAYFPTFLDSPWWFLRDKEGALMRIEYLDNQINILK